MQLWEVQRSGQPASLNLLLLITAAWVISSAIYVAWLALLEFQILTDFETGMCQNQTVTSQMLFYSLTPALVESGSWSCQKLALTRRKAFWSDAEEGSIAEEKKVTWSSQMHIFRTETWKSLKSLLIHYKSNTLNCCCISWGQYLVYHYQPLSA